MAETRISSLRLFILLLPLSGPSIVKNWMIPLEEESRSPPCR